MKTDCSHWQGFSAAVIVAALWCEKRRPPATSASVTIPVETIKIPESAHHIAISQKQLEDAVLRLLQEHIRVLAELDGCLQTIRNAPIHRLSIRKAEERLAAVEADIDRYRKLKISAYEDMRDGILSKEDYLDIKEQYEMRISEAQLAEEQIRHEIDLYIENGTHLSDGYRSSLITAIFKV